MTEAAVYRENALKVRRLTIGVTGEAAKAALLLAAEYEARARDLDDIPASERYLTAAERLGALITAHGVEIAEISKRERALELRIAEARGERALLEARVAGIVEAVRLIDVPNVMHLATKQRSVATNST